MTKTDNMYLPVHISSCIFVLVGLLLSSTGCRETDSPLTDSNTDDTQLHLSARIAGDMEPSSRITLDGNRFPASSTTYVFGTWICLHEDIPKEFIPAKNGYSNLRTEMKATENGDEYNEEWNYVFENRPHTSLNVNRGIPIDIYTFYPRPQSGTMATRPDRVPFTSGQTDWMWSAVSVSSEEVKGNKTTVKLNFEHAMTCLEIRMKSRYSGSLLTSITLKDKKNRLYLNGYMNIAERKLILDETQTTNLIKIDYGTLLTTTENKFHIIIPPVKDYETGDFTLSFVFNNNPAKTEFTIPAKMDNGVVISEFARGKRYIYRLTLDNHTRFEPVGIDDTWITTDYELIL